MAHRRHIIPLSKVPSNLKSTEKTTTVSNKSNINNDKSNCIDKDEQNHSCNWPSLPTLQLQNHQQNTAIEEDSNLLQHHQQSVVTAVEDDDTTTYASHSDRRKRLLTQYFNVSFFFV